VDGVHDLGGLDGFGPVEHEDAEPFFREPWERRVFRLMVGSIGALGGPGGRFRHSIERMDPAHYLSSPYYEHWLTGVTTLAVESGFATQDELEHRAGGRFPLSRPDRGLLPEDLTERTEPRYALGDDVRAVQLTPPHSPCSIAFGKGLTTAQPGSVQRLEMVVSDIEAAREDLLNRGVEVSEVFHRDGGRLVPGPDPERRSYLSYAAFSDPDGNGWLLQEITTRLPGREWDD